MAQAIQTNTGQSLPLPEGIQGIVADWSSDQRAFKNVPWGKAMMWIFLLSDTFIFSCFLISYMTVRMRSEEHTSELQSRLHLVCRLLLEKKKKTKIIATKTPPSSTFRN